MLFVSITSAPRSSEAQYGPYWKKIGQLPPGRGGIPQSIGCGYFWSATKGLVGTTAGTFYNIRPSDPRIYYTTDGATWTQSFTPAYAQTTTATIGSIRMLDDKIGFAAINNQRVTDPAIWQTVDGGRSWNVYSNILGAAMDVFLTKSGQLVALLVTRTQLYFTQGAYDDDNRIIIGHHRNSQRSTDGGSTWMQGGRISNNPGYRYYGLTFMKKHKLFMTCEHDNDYEGAFSFVSSDKGVTWTSQGKMVDATAYPIVFTGDVKSGAEYSYMQTLDEYYPNGGFYRSADGGKNWKWVGGPGNNADTRFVVFGCKGAHVIGFDLAGGIWYTETGGDGTISEGPATVNLERTTCNATSSLCKSASFNVKLWNDNCDSVMIHSVTVNDPWKVLLTSGALTIDTAKVAPRLLDSFSPLDSIGFTWTPNKYFTKDTVIAVQVKIHFFSGTTKQFRDTIITLNLRADLAPLDYVLSPLPMTVRTITECEVADTVLTIRNRGCAEIRFMNQGLGDSTNFVIAGTADTMLAPDQSLQIPIRFLPSARKTFSTYLHFQIWSQGHWVRDSVLLRGKGIAGESIFVSDKDTVLVPPIGFCHATTVTGAITNPGCDTLVISTATITGSTGYSLAPISLPAFIPPGDTFVYTVRHAPSTIGTHTALLEITSYSAHDILRSELHTFPIFGDATDESQNVSVWPTSINFAPINFCEQGDSVVTVMNQGCDTLIVETMSLYGDAEFTGTAPQLPFALGPDQQASYGIRLLPDLKGRRQTTLSIDGRYVRGLKPRRTFTVPIEGVVVDGPRILATTPRAIDFGNTTLCTDKDSVITVKNVGCDTITITSIDIDDLGFTSSTKLPIVLPPGAERTLDVSTVVDTTNQQPNSTGTCTITSNADSTQGSVGLLRSYTYPTQYSFSLRMVEEAAHSGDTVRLAVMGERGLGRPQSQIDELDFRLTLNEDLLHFLRATSDNIIIRDGNHYVIRHPVELTSTNDTLAMLYYEVRLTRDTATLVTGSQYDIQGVDKTDCRPKLSAMSASFDYLFRCGEHALHKYMVTNSINSISISPNPASDRVRIRFVSEQSAPMQVRIFTTLGSIIVEENIAATTGENIIDLRLPESMSGMLTVELRTEAGAATRSFIKE